MLSRKKFIYSLKILIMFRRFFGRVRENEYVVNINVSSLQSKYLYVFITQATQQRNSKNFLCIPVLMVGK